MLVIQWTEGMILSPSMCCEFSVPLYWPYLRCGLSTNTLVPMASPPHDKGGQQISSLPFQRPEAFLHLGLSYSLPVAHSSLVSGGL